jgi:hypothetical protein
MNNDSFLAANQSASAFTATDFSALTRSALTTDLPKTASSYAIAAGGLFTDNGGGNFSGDLNNPFDDARIAANGGLTINGWPTVSALGSSIVVGPGAIVADAVRQRWKVENLAQPVAISVPAYVEPPIGAFDRTFDVGQLPLNGAADVARAFGDGQLPSVVHFTGGSLALPSDTVLRNLTIVVEHGDLNFNGDRHLLENVTLIVKDGRVNFGDVRAVNTAVFASDGIDLNQRARFSGKNLLVTQHGDVVFDGATVTIDPKDFVKVLAQDGNIFLNAAADVRGEFWSSEDFFANQASTIVGKIRAERNITFNAPVQVVWDGLEDTPVPPVAAPENPPNPVPSPIQPPIQPQPLPTNIGTFGGIAVSGNFYTAYQSVSGPNGILGNPISGVQSYGGATYQLFKGGSIVSSQYGTYPIFGGIREAYRSQGGLEILGAPKTREIGLGNGVIKQEFESAYIIWNGQTATVVKPGDGNSSISPTPNQTDSSLNTTPVPECLTDLSKTAWDQV